MSFSLSSLLNPAPSGSANDAPEQPRRESLPPVQYVQSPEQHYATAPHAPQQHNAYPAVTQQEAAQVLASLHSGSIPAPAPGGYYGFSGAPDYAQQEAAARRSSSSHGAAIELPPPSASGRKASSPSLEQYHVSSRSPEQRRASAVLSPQQPPFTLPPIHRVTSHDPPPRRTSSITHQPSPVEHPPSIPANPYIEQAVEEEPASSTIPAEEADAMARIKNVSSVPAAPAVSEAHTTARPTSPSQVKQERLPTPRASSPLEVRRGSVQADAEGYTSKAIASLKSEQSIRTQSPLRESSVPMPSTEVPLAENSKKRPAPSKKKGTATAKKAPAAKKRKVERSETPASRNSKVPTLKTASSKGTPAGSSPAPSTRSYSADPEEDRDDEDVDSNEDVEGDGEVYCLCRKPDNGTFMIGCDGTCDDWYHGKCVGIEERDKHLIDKYMCPACQKSGQGRTTWKRICRRRGCRQPAKVGKNKNGKEGSKYCSDECGVMYFRETLARARGREDTARHRSSRRKNSIDDRPAVEDDLGAKGGVLSVGEVKALVNESKTADDFKKLGNGVLSPPATPTSPTKTTLPSDKTDANHADFTESETASLERIAHAKDAARERHQLLKDRMKFITMVKQAASRTTAERELKPKEYCGYDPRLEWNEEQFRKWRESKVGNRAFELETLATENSGGAGASTNGHVGDREEGNDLDAEGVYAQISICDRKKCARHLEWGKLCVDDLRFEMGDNSDHMRALDKEEKGIRERAALRSKAGGNVNGEGTVEIHEIGGEGVEVDGEAVKAVFGVGVGGGVKETVEPVAEDAKMDEAPLPAAGTAAVA